MTEKVEQGISRRAFIKDTAAGTGIIAAAGGGLIGNRTDKVYAATQSNKYPFETPPPAVPAGDIKQTIVADVVVVGLGMAGIPATLTAVEAGVKVAALEKQDSFNAMGNQDIGMIGTKWHKAHGMSWTPEVTNEAIRELMKWGGNRIDQRLLRIWVNRGPEDWDWLTAMTDPAGINWQPRIWPPPKPWDNTRENYKQYPTAASISMSEFVRMLNVLADKAKSLGAALHFGTTAKQFVKTQNRVTGVIAQNKNGDYIQFNANKGIILCTGDYGYNTEMLEKYVPHVAFRKHSMKPTSMGEGHQMAMWIGAQMEATPHAPMCHAMGFGLLGNTAFLHVNKFGERFQNEDVSGQAWNDQVEEQPGMIAWQIIDSNWKERLPYMSIGHGSMVSADDGSMPMLNNAINANTMEELAAKMSIPVAALKATVERYNKMAYAGIDTDFAKPSHRLFPIDKPPFYAGKAGPAGMLVVMGGLLCNADLQAYDADFNVIRGLYLAGNTVGRRFAVSYPTTCPGVSNGLALTHGRYAALKAVADDGK
jgi:fumarate reductase flavoprotein subunit